MTKWAGQRAFGLLAIIVVLFGIIATPGHAALDVDKVEPSIVRIEVGSSFGSGFFVTNDGVIATNYHVVAGADRIIVRPSGDLNGYEARVLWQSRLMDLALLTVKGVRRKPLTLFTGNPPRASNVSVVGFSGKCDAAAGGRTLNTCATRGVVSLLENDTGRSRRVVQSDAVINRGSSGGPLLDDCGRVVGVAAQGFGGAGGEALYVAIHSSSLVSFMRSDELKSIGLKPITTTRACVTDKARPDEVARSKAEDAEKKAQSALETTRDAQAKAEQAQLEAEAAAREAEQLKRALKVQEELLATQKELLQAEQEKQAAERAQQQKVNRGIALGVAVTVLLTLVTLALALRRPRQQIIHAVEQVSRTIMPSAGRSAVGNGGTSNSGAPTVPPQQAVRRRSGIAPLGDAAPHDVLLTITLPDGIQHQYLLTAARLGQTWFGVTLGRHKGLVDHVIDSPELSRRHVRVRWHKDGFEIEDLNSTNGTLLNGVALLPYKPNRLRMEDEIMLGRVTARVSKALHDSGTI